MFQSKIVADPDSALFQNYLDENLRTPKDISKQLVLLDFTHWKFDGTIGVGQMIANRDAVCDIVAFLQRAFEIRFPIHSAQLVSRLHFSDTLSCTLNNSSCHNMRRIDDDSGRWSLHAIGFAFDINPELNPCIILDENRKETSRLPSFGEYNPKVRGTLTLGHELVKLMEERGWEWGGSWTTLKDYQHFQKKRDLLSPEMRKYV